MEKDNKFLIDSNLKKYTIKSIKKIDAAEADSLAMKISDVIMNKELNEKEQFEYVKMLIKCGANINYNFYNNYSLLTYAVSNKRYEVAKLLIQAGADITKRSSYDTSPIYWACVFQNFELIGILVEKGALKHYSNSTKPLIIAVLEREYPSNTIINYLLENGVGPDETDNQNHTALFYAAAQGNKQIVITLLEHGANPLIKSNYKNKTAYDFAIMSSFDVANIIEIYEQKWQAKLEAKEKEEPLNKIFEEVIDDMKVKVAKGKDEQKNQNTTQTKEVKTDETKEMN